MERSTAMTVGEVCKRNVVIAVKNETIVDAANHMRTGHVGDLVVIETQQNRRVPVGIITIATSSSARSQQMAVTSTRWSWATS
jgi:predicted transcriptional regulator